MYMDIAISVVVSGGGVLPSDMATATELTISTEMAVVTEVLNRHTVLPLLTELYEFLKLNRRVFA